MKNGKSIIVVIGSAVILSALYIYFFADIDIANDEIPGIGGFYGRSRVFQADLINKSDKTVTKVELKINLGTRKMLGSMDKYSLTDCRDSDNNPISFDKFTTANANTTNCFEIRETFTLKCQNEVNAEPNEAFKCITTVPTVSGHNMDYFFHVINAKGRRVPPAVPKKSNSTPAY